MARPTRIPDSETRDRVMSAARDLLKPTGLSVTLGDLSAEEIIAAAGVSRSAAYRLWPTKDALVSDVLTFLATSPEMSFDVTDAGSMRAALQVACDNLDQLDTAAGRRDLLLRCCQIGGETQFGSITGSFDWRTWVALVVTVAATHGEDTTIRDRLRATRYQSTAGLAEFYEAMAGFMGLRLRADFGGDWLTASKLVSSLFDGLALNNAVAADFTADRVEAAPFGSTQTSSWTLPGLGFAAIASSLLEPDPEYDEATIPHVKRLVSSMLAKVSPPAATDADESTDQM